MKGTPPAPPLELPEAVRAWAKGHVDRAVSRGADGSTSLTLFLPGETLQARFATADAAGLALRARTVPWVTVSRVIVGGWGNRRGRGS